MASAMKTRFKMLGLGIGMAASLMMSAGAMAQGEKPAPPKEPAKEPAKAPVKTDQPAEALPKGEEIMDRYVKETGGKEAYEKIKTMVLTGQMNMPMDMKGTMKVYVVRPGKMLSELNIDGIGEIKSGSDGETVWSDNPMQGPRVLEGSEREMAMDGAKISEEANWRERYTKVECVGVANVADKPAYKVELTPKEGSKRMAFYDKESGLLVKQEMTMQSQMGEMPVEILMSDYKKVGDVLMPHKTSMSFMQQSMVTIFDKVEFNVEVPDSKFELPAEVKALKEKKAKKDAEPKAPADPVKK